MDCGELNCEYCNKDKCIYMMDNNAEREVQKMNLEKMTDEELEELLEEIAKEKENRRNHLCQKVENLFEEMKTFAKKNNIDVVLITEYGEVNLFDDVYNIDCIA